MDKRIKPPTGAEKVVRVPSELYVQLIARAAEQDRSITSVLHRILVGKEPALKNPKRS